MNATNVLCVENNVEKAAPKRLLEAAGYRVIPATTGSQALTLFTNESIRGVLLEYKLPDSTGTAVRREMKCMKPDIPVLLFAGESDQTPLLLRFLNSYIRTDKSGWAPRDLDS